MRTDAGLTETEMMSLIHDYIGVEGGYLRGFSYASHEEFYPRFCDFRVDVSARRKEHGTTRATFLAILRESDPDRQARIVDGVFRFLPVDEGPEEQRSTRTRAKEQLAGAVARLRGQAVQVDDLGVKNATVERAIRDADLLIREHGNTSGVDRIHTALHGYLRSLCLHHGLAPDDGADATRLLKVLRTQVPALQTGLARKEDVARVQGALATIVDALNPIRNQASMAHPNDGLLEIAEAALVIDAARSVLNYLNRKLA